MGNVGKFVHALTVYIPTCRNTVLAYDLFTKESYIVSVWNNALGTFTQIIVDRTITSIKNDIELIGKYNHLA